jgi:hypothetical protein
MLDGIFPQLLPLMVVLGTWYLMAKRGVSPVKAMVLLLVLAALASRRACLRGNTQKTIQPGLCPGSLWMKVLPQLGIFVRA